MKQDLVINRRKMLLGGSALLTATVLPGCIQIPSQRWLVSACSDRAGNHYAAAVTTDGQLINKVKLPQRAHDALALPHKPGHALLFARRPDRFMVEVDFVTGIIEKQVNSATDSHFYGHGVLSADNQYLFTTENLFDKSQGVVVVRDTQTYQVLARYDSGGIGPHELALMPDGKTLVIANGGIQTHPMTPRVKLNLHNMQPNLAYLDLASGQVIDRFQPPHHQLSLRHLDVADDSSVFVGAQYQGPKTDALPLVFMHKGEQQLQTFRATEQQWLSMRQYTASLLVDKKLLCVSCPRANRLTYWHIDRQEFIGADRIKDVSGLTGLNGKGYASSGLGQLIQVNDNSLVKASFDGLMFDNHMTHIQAA